MLHELHTAMKTHQTYQSEFRQAENKLQIVEKQRNKLYASVAEEKRPKHKRLRVIEKEFQKRRLKYDEARLKATKARNEYLLNMDAANSSIQKYFVDDLSDLIDCMDFGFHQVSAVNLDFLLTFYKVCIKFKFDAVEIYNFVQPFSPWVAR